MGRCLPACQFLLEQEGGERRPEDASNNLCVACCHRQETALAGCAHAEARPAQVLCVEGVQCVAGMGLMGGMGGTQQQHRTTLPHCKVFYF